MPTMSQPTHPFVRLAHSLCIALLCTACTETNVAATTTPSTTHNDGRLLHIPTDKGTCTGACPTSLVECHDTAEISLGTHTMMSKQPQMMITVVVVDVEPPRVHCGAPDNIPWQPQLTIVPAATDNCNVSWHRALGTDNQ